MKNEEKKRLADAMSGRGTNTCSEDFSPRANALCAPPRSAEAEGRRNGVSDKHSHYELSLYNEAPRSSSFNKLRKKLMRRTRQAMVDFAMVKEEARWLVCISGGKDSYSLLTLLHDLKWRGHLPVELIAMNLDQRQPGFPDDVLPNYLKKHNLPFHIETQDTYSIVTDKIPENKTYCSLCSRLRRGIIYTVARRLKCDTVVLGHHSEDILETFLLNLFFGHKLASMPPKLLNDEGDLYVVRPLAYAQEKDLIRFSEAMNYPIIPCNLCGSQDGMQRQNMKQMLNDWELKRPGTKLKMLKAMGNVRPSHLLDKSLYDFEGL